MVEKRGKIFVIEGTDCSGKETQSNLLATGLHEKWFPVKTRSFPVYDSPTGDVIKRYLGKDGYAQEFGPANEVNPRVASTWYAADRFTNSSDIAKRSSHWVLDRWVESNMAHQGGKIADARERREFVDWLDNLEYGSFGLPRPDAVLFLYMPYQVGMRLRENRGEAADGHESNPEHLQHAESVYLELAERFEWTKIDCAPDGTYASLRSREDIAEEVMHHALKVIRS